MYKLNKIKVCVEVEVVARTRAGKVLCPIDVVGDTEPLKVQVPGVKITPFSYPFVFIKWFAKESRVSSVFDWRITARHRLVHTHSSDTYTRVRGTAAPSTALLVEVMV